MSFAIVWFSVFSAIVAAEAGGSDHASTDSTNSIGAFQGGAESGLMSADWSAEEEVGPRSNDAAPSPGL
jgi:hypothetical protein